MSSALVLPEADLQPVDWKTVDNATYDWLNVLLEMRERIIWENQKVAQPDYPYLSLLRNPENDTGLDETRTRTVDTDGKILGIDPGAGSATGNESITYQPINWTLTVQAHVDPATGGNNSGCNAMSMLGKAKRSLGQGSTIDKFGAAGVSIIRPISLTDTSVEVNGEWISKASLDVLFGTASVMSEAQEFISKVSMDVLGVDLTVDAS